MTTNSCLCAHAGSGLEPEYQAILKSLRRGCFVDAATWEVRLRAAADREAALQAKLADKDMQLKQSASREAALQAAVATTIGNECRLRTQVSVMKQQLDKAMADKAEALRLVAALKKSMHMLAGVKSTELLQLLMVSMSSMIRTHPQYSCA